MIHLTGVRVLIWDVDGTFYPATEQVVRSVNDSAISSICEVMKWPREKAITEFNKVHGKITISQTEAVSIICNITTAEAANLTDKYLNRLQYIKKDPQLIALFEKLNNFQHYILGNGAQKPIEEGVKALGLNPSIFKEIVTSETVGVNKPNDNGFRYIMEKTGLPAAAHLMIGDRERVDLAPAKALGMHTCLVWAVKPSLIADVTVPNVYDVAQILI